jgi:hypothetical protein
MTLSPRAPVTLNPRAAVNISALNTHDVAATYLTLRLEAAERHIGVRLIDPDLPQLPRVAWHERRDPGASTLAWLTRSN